MSHQSCPIAYRLSIEQMKKKQPVNEAKTVYIIGGLYGNTAALTEVLRLAHVETTCPTLVFNGDFNWFNRDVDDFKLINQTVLKHIALRGNVETELADVHSQSCGCHYPDWVSLTTVNDANQIMQMLRCSPLMQETALLNQLAGLPTFYKFKIGSVTVLVLHGDPAHLAGWGLAYENMPKIGEKSDQISKWFEQLDIDVIACSHTCLPFIQNWNIERKVRLVMNNGSAGMANFSYKQCPNLCGVISRISLIPAPFSTLYGTKLQHIYFDAVPVSYDLGWISRFEQQWQPQSAAYRSYYQRITKGTQHTIKQANRIFNY